MGVPGPREALGFGSIEMTVVLQMPGRGCPRPRRARLQRAMGAWLTQQPHLPCLGGDLSLRRQSPHLYPVGAEPYLLL